MTPRLKAAPLLKTLWLLLAALAAAACADGGAQDDRGQVRVKVANVGFDQESRTHFVLLEDQAGNRTLPILIGDDEARAIMLELRGVKPPRPLTYELLRNVIEQTGNRVDRIVIGQVRDEVYYARIFLDGGRYKIDSRPSDAIALALGAKAPIFVSDHLFAAGVPRPTPAVRTAKGFGMTVQELTPELADYFGVPARSGVLVAEVEVSAARIGLLRGDIITQIEGRESRTPAEFEQDVMAAGNSSEVALTVRRGGSSRTFIVAMAAVGAAPTPTSGP
jgi:bifunctional DNase/RNase